MRHPTRTAPIRWLLYCGDCGAEKTLIMKIETKYSTGDIVAGVRSQEARQIVKCQCCQNTGKVTIGAEEFVCPKCKGEALHPVFRGQKWFVYIEGATIGQVRFKHTDVRSDYPGESGPQTEIEYMLRETGVGSGQVWKESELFTNRTEAQAHCDALNLGLPEDEA